MRLSLIFSAAAMAFALTGMAGTTHIAFAQTQNSSDAGKRNDPDAASDVQEAVPAKNPPPSANPALIHQEFPGNLDFQHGGPAPGQPDVAAKPETDDPAAIHKDYPGTLDFNRGNDTGAGSGPSTK